MKLAVMIPMQGYDLARVAALKFLDEFKQAVKPDDREVRLLPLPMHLLQKLIRVSCEA